MSEFFSSLVIGGGPAGSSAAHVLAAAGLDVALVDKAVFPRDKLCGGLLTRRAAKAYAEVFADPWQPVVRHSAHGVRFFHQHRLLNECSDGNELALVRRLDFDAFLLRQAERRGARLILGDGVASLDPAAKTCRLRSGREIGFDTLIGADGVNSLVAKSLFGRAFDPRSIGFALEVEVDREEADVAGDAVDVPEIVFGLARWGYLWTFPKQDTLTVGIGGLHRKNPALRQLFESYLRTRFGRLPRARIKGHHLPFGDYRKVPGQGDVLLCGDAAGLVEPITGEGIAFALLSGRLAAEAILGARRSGGNALQHYRKGYASITEDFDHANRLRLLLFPELCQRLFLKALPGSQGLVRRHLALMADEIGYREYSRQLLSSLGRRLTGKLLRF